MRNMPEAFGRSVWVTLGQVVDRVKNVLGNVKLAALIKEVGGTPRLGDSTIRSQPATRLRPRQPLTASRRYGGSDVGDRQSRYVP